MCNVVFWDFIIVAFLTGTYVRDEFSLHPVLSFLIAIIAGGLTIALMSVKYIGVIVKLFFALLCETMVFDILDAFFHIQDEAPDIQITVIEVILFVFCYAAHNIFLEKMGMTNSVASKRDERLDEIDFDENKYNYHQEDLERRLKIYGDKAFQVLKKGSSINQKAGDIAAYGISLENIEWELNKHNELCMRLQFKIDEATEKFEDWIEYKEADILLKDMGHISKEIEKLQEKLIYELDRMSRKIHEKTSYDNKKENNDFIFSLFAGCDSKESLTKRYRSLLKIYHPDNAGGDTKMTQDIQNAYDQLIKQY